MAIISSLFGNMRATIQLTVISVVIVATILTAGLAISLQYYFGQSMAREAAADLYATASSSVAGELRSVGRINANIIDLLADNPALLDPTEEAARIEILVRVLQKNPLYYGIYLAGADGSLFTVINLDASDTARKKLRALHTDRWLIITLQEGESGQERHYRYLNENMDVRLSRSDATGFDVHQRPWYISASTSDSAQFSEPYIFEQLGAPGRTVSKRIKDSDMVVAIDMTLTAISGFLSEHRISEHGDVYLFNSVGEVIASNLDYENRQPDLPNPKLMLTDEEKEFVAAQPALNVSNELNWPPFDYSIAGHPSGYSVDIIKLIAKMTGLKLRFTNGYSWPALVQLYEKREIDLLQSVILTDTRRKMGLPGLSYAELPYALATLEHQDPVSDLAQLNGRQLAIPEGWSIISTVRARFPQVTIIETESTLKALELVLAGEAAAALDNEIIMRYVARSYFLMGMRYHSGVNFGEVELPDKLHILVANDRMQLRQLLDRAIAAIEPEHYQFLSDKWLALDEDTKTALSNVVPNDILIRIAAESNQHGELIETDIKGEAFLAYAAPTDDSENPLFMGILTSRESVVAPFLSQVKLSIFITGAFLLCLLPLSWLFANPIVRPIKQLAIENDKVQRREYTKVRRITSHIKELDELSESMVSMVSSIQSHELAQRALMDSFIELIAQAIDDKSAYTGGHCKRVPELALLLAEHASDSNLPAFQQFSLNTDDEWREYRIAAWLHDCGKITTPEHIVDKGSKLETIYNRIHEVRMRFEVLWRDAQIDYLKQRAEAPERSKKFADQLEARQCELQEQFSFVAHCNVGGEFLDKDKVNRLQTIATTTWQRFFDDRLGLSPLEELRASLPTSTLPATENLLSDKPEHIIEREQTTDYPPEFGINMDIPKHLYNLGEIYNLSVSRGTLTKEDRFKINEHMISTIKILESLPFPEELNNVPRYASTHHETLTGSGYPRKLTGEQLSIPDRILAIADIFEALTASDRPYKKAKPVSTALNIMYKMVQDSHIDRDCFELFLRDEVYLVYARKFLPAGQIDEVDLKNYLTS